MRFAAAQSNDFCHCLFSSIKGISYMFTIRPAYMNIVVQLADRPHRAGHTLEKLKGLQKIQAKRRPTPAPKPELAPAVPESLPAVSESVPSVPESAQADFAGVGAPGALHPPLTAGNNSTHL
jgi:hypothetical protein